MSPQGTLGLFITKRTCTSRYLAGGLPVWRLRLTGLIARIEHTNRYVLTPDGITMAVFYTKVHNRLLRPLMATSRPQAPPELRQALRVIDQHVDASVIRARLGKAA